MSFRISFSETNYAWISKYYMKFPVIVGTGNNREFSSASSERLFIGLTQICTIAAGPVPATKTQQEATGLDKPVKPRVLRSGPFERATLQAMTTPEAAKDIKHNRNTISWLLDGEKWIKELRLMNLEYRLGWWPRPARARSRWASATMAVLPIMTHPGAASPAMSPQGCARRDR
jgi:hypothetical protein